MTDATPDHPYFHPLPDRAERLATFLHKRWQEHEAAVAQWTNPTPRPWESLESDQQRGYRAIAVAAVEFIEPSEAKPSVTTSGYPLVELLPGDRVLLRLPGTEQVVSGNQARDIALALGFVIMERASNPLHG